MCLPVTNSVTFGYNVELLSSNPYSNYFIFLVISHLAFEFLVIIPIMSLAQYAQITFNFVLENMFFPQ